jgi:hypothetical protein
MTQDDGSHEIQHVPTLSRSYRLHRFSERPRINHSDQDHNIQKDIIKELIVRRRVLITF